MTYKDQDTIPPLPYNSEWQEHVGKKFSDPTVPIEILKIKWKKGIYSQAAAAALEARSVSPTTAPAPVANTAGKGKDWWDGYNYAIEEIQEWLTGRKGGKV